MIVNHHLLAAIVAFTLATGLALAQTTPDVPALQKIISILQAQRNQALDQQALAETRAATLAEENDKLRTELKEKTKESK